MPRAQGMHDAGTPMGIQPARDGKIDEMIKRIENLEQKVEVASRITKNAITIIGMYGRIPPKDIERIYRI